MKRRQDTGVRTTRALPTRRDTPAVDADAATDELDLDRGLGELLDDDRRQRAIEDRRDQDVARTIERDTATFVGLLRDLAEHTLAVVVEHAGGRVAGRVVGLGTDCVILERRGTAGRSVLPLAEVLTVVAESGQDGPEARAHRKVVTDLELRPILAEAAEERVEVRVHVRHRPEVLGGFLRAVGEDVLSVGSLSTRTTCTFVNLQHVVRIDLMP